MDSLANFLVENILNEEVNPITALFGGGFKPPTSGHLEVVKKAINDNPEIDKIIIYVGGKARNGVTQDQAIEIWDKFYKPQINKPVEILPSVAPIKDIYRYAKNNPEETVYWVIGAREGREDDLKDIANRSISIDKYPNLQLKTTSTPDGGMSGTNARKAIVNNNFEEFERYLPDNVDKNAIWDILTKQELNEIDLKKYVDKIKKGFNKFIEALKQEKQETKDAFNLLVQAVKEKKELSPEEKKEIGNQLKDVFKTIGYVGLFALPGGSLFTILFNLLKLNKYVLPSAFLDKQELNEADPKTGTGKKPKGSGRRLYTDEDPSDTVKVKFSSRQDIVDTLNKKSFKAKSHARQSQIINLIHQRVRAAYNRAKDPDVKRRLKTALDYAEKRKEASKKKTQRLKKENIDPKAQAKHKGKAAPFGSAYEPVKEKKSGGRGTRYRAIEKRGNQYYYIQDNPFSPGIRQEFGPYKTKEAALKKMGTFPPASSYRDITEKDIKETGLKIAKKNMDDYKRSNNPSGKKPKDPFGLNQFARELMKEEDSFDTFDYPKHLKLYTQYMLDQGMDIRPLPKVKFINNDIENAKEFLGKTAYYDPANRLIVLYTLNRHPKDVMRSFSHEMIHHLQNNQNRLGNVVTTNTNQDDHVDNLEKEANLLGTMTFRHWTDTLTEGVLKEGRYDRISNEISSNIFNYWKKDFEAGKEASRYFDNVNNELDIDIDANITFLPNSEKLTIDGGADEAVENGESAYLEVRFEVDPEMLPEFWEEISMNLKDVIRHEIEHITQSGYSAAGGYKKVYKKVDGKWEETDEYEWQGKDFKDDQFLRDMIDMELLPKAQYFKLAKEIDANLQGMYFRAKKEKRLFGDIINNYLDAQDITAKEKEEILDLWRNRNKVLNLPQF